MGGHGMGGHGTGGHGMGGRGMGGRGASADWCRELLSALRGGACPSRPIGSAEGGRAALFKDGAVVAAGRAGCGQW